MARQKSHRYDRLPLLSSLPGGVRQELIVSACRCKSRIIWNKNKTNNKKLIVVPQPFEGNSFIIERCFPCNQFKLPKKGIDGGESGHGTHFKNG
jgi:hypothetical protein